jgi:DNA-binding winged helix-turn-helix (wHTH) protein
MAAPQWQFEDFRLDPVNARLWRGAEPLALPPKVFDVLHSLVTHPDRLVTKDELLDTVWPNTAVTDAVVRVAIGTLRKVLDDTQQPFCVIATVPRRGYRFLTPVTVVPPPPLAPAPAPPPPGGGLSGPAIAAHQEDGAPWRCARCHQPLSRTARFCVACGTAVAQTCQACGQVVAVVGEAGVGKSRLLYEFVQAAQTQGWLGLESAAMAYGQATPYFPVCDLLRRYCRLEERDDTSTIQTKVTQQVLRLDAALQNAIPALLGLLDALPADSPFLRLDAPQRRQHTLAALKRVLLRQSQVQPLLLVCEDLHWLDTETQALLDGLSESPSWGTPQAWPPSPDC